MKTINYSNQPSLFDWADSLLEIKLETSTCTKRITETPLMRQYHEMKRKHPDTILLFRVGDFYELFAEDARVASEILKITLTRRCGSPKDNPIYLAGFPHYALDSYLPKLVRFGKRVAICEQLEDPKITNNQVKRSIPA